MGLEEVVKANEEIIRAYEYGEYERVIEIFQNTGPIVQTLSEDELSSLKDTLLIYELTIQSSVKTGYVEDALKNVTNQIDRLEKENRNSYQMSLIKYRALMSSNNLDEADHLIDCILQKYPECTIDILISKAKGHVEVRKHDLAIQEFTEVLDLMKSRDDPRIRYDIAEMNCEKGMGRAMLDLGRLEEAEAHLKKALSIEREEETLNRLGRIFFEKSVTQDEKYIFEAVAYQEEALALKPSLLNKLVLGGYLSNLAASRNKPVYAKAKNLLKEIMRPSEILNRIGLKEIDIIEYKMIYANCEANTGGVDEAIKILESLIANNLADKRKISTDLGMLYERKSDLKKAVEWLEKAIEEGSTTARKDYSLVRIRNELNIYRTLGQIYLTLNEYKKARKNLEIALKIGSHPEFTLCLIGDTYFGEKNYTEAKKFFLESKKANENSPYAYSGLAEIELEHGNAEDALRLLMTSLKKNRNYYAANNTNEVCLIRLRQAFEKMNIKKDLSDVFETTKKVISEFEKYESQFAIFAFIQYSGESIKSIKLDEHIVRLLSQTDEGLTMALSPSRNVVKSTTFRLNNIGNTDYIIKLRSAEGGPQSEKEKTTAWKEYVVEQFLSSILIDHHKQNDLQRPVPVQQPIVYIRENKYELLINRKVFTPSLKEFEEHAEKEELQEQIALALKNLATVHVITFPYVSTDILKMSDSQGNILSTDLGRFNYENNINRRLLSRLKATGKELFIEEYRKSINTEESEKHTALINGDANACNVGVEGYLYDWETATRGNPMYDVVHLISNIDFQDIDKKNLLKEYLSELRTLGINERALVSIADTFQDNLEHILLCKIGSNINQGHIPRAKDYYDYAVQVMEERGHTGLIDKLTKILSADNRINAVNT